MCVCIKYTTIYAHTHTHSYIVSCATCGRVVRSCKCAPVWRVGLLRVNGVCTIRVFGCGPGSRRVCRSIGRYMFEYTSINPVHFCNTPPPTIYRTQNASIQFGPAQNAARVRPARSAPWEHPDKVSHIAALEKFRKHSHSMRSESRWCGSARA